MKSTEGHFSVPPFRRTNFGAAVWASASSSHFSTAQNTGECDQFSAGYLLRCVGPLLHYAKYNVQPKIGVPRLQVASSNHSSSNRTANFGDGVCHLYKDYKTCAPAELRRKCSNLVATLEAVYDYVCSSNVLKYFSAHLDCLLEVDSHDPGVLNCEQNATESLRQIASSTDKSGDERVDRQCDAVQQYFYCMMDKYLNTCGQEAWQLKVDITKRSTSVELANCSFVTTPKPRDFTKPKCRDKGVCLCHNGYKLKDNSTCEDIDECLQPGLCSQTCKNEPGTFTCLCNENYYEKSDDGRRCIPTQPYLFFAHGQSIWNITLDGKDFQLKKASLQKTAMLDLDVEVPRH
uniref:EGF-like calcium-binding domain-containing protein n=1 Tax=Romanomermis culicivorax TaxID=13658 RepID=A0A915IR16_ROMCU